MAGEWIKSANLWFGGDKINLSIIAQKILYYHKLKCHVSQIKGRIDMSSWSIQYKHFIFAYINFQYKRFYFAIWSYSAFLLHDQARYYWDIVLWDIVAQVSTMQGTAIMLPWVVVFLFFYC